MDETLIVGLGNPGYQYEGTRHNVGFQVVDCLARRWKREWSPGKGEFLYLRKRFGGAGVVLLKPLTFMNLSGIAVREAMPLFGIEQDRILVVIDDVALPLGSLRLRPAGSDGGHNGLASVIGSLGTEEIARCRCGIGPKDPETENDLADFVLSPFHREELKLVTAMVARCADAIEFYCREGLETTMSRFNSTGSA
ncbi:MAG: aminoacyl-tRNA hydrolase [Ignavibacteria bacterium]|nr:aminoacyl-tRNA hydrolase [Ignavibacteria bacterium]